MRNRKQTYRYSLGGRKLADLESDVRALRGKLADPNDKDDKRWVARWLKRLEREVLKKQKSMEAKSHGGTEEDLPS